VTLLLDNSGSQRGVPILYRQRFRANVHGRALGAHANVKVEILRLYHPRMEKGGQAREAWLKRWLTFRLQPGRSE